MEIQRSMEKDNQNDLQNQETQEKGIIFVRIAMFSLLISAAVSFAGLLMMIL